MQTIELESFRREVRAFLADAVPGDIRAAVRARWLVTRDHAQRWQRILHAKGWAAPGWPREHGGPGWSLVQQAVFREELAACEAPRVENLGIDTIGPTLMRHGTPAQCARFLPRMLSFDDFWAQAYSEPDAGSDLASLRTTARREGDHFVLDGTKIWQSYGHWANWALVLVRSDPSAPRKQDGISVLLVDLASPGVTIRPIRFMHGGVLHVQMFFDDVRVPAANLVGAQDQGWSVAKGLLVIERLFVARVAECKADLVQLRRLARERGATGAAANPHDPRALRLASLEIRARALEAAWWPTVRAVDRGEQPALESSLLKLLGNEVLQGLQQLQLDLLGADALAFDPRAADGAPGEPLLVPGHAGNFTMHLWRYRGITLGGGTSEVQRDIVAKAIFGGRTQIEQPLAAGLDEQQAMLDGGLRKVLAQHYDFDRRREILSRPDGEDDGFRRAVGELGLHALGVPERDGGFGGTLADLVPVMQALGEALVLEPVLWASVLPARLLIPATGFGGRARALAALLAGEGIAFAHTDRGAPLRAVPDGGGWRLSGAKALVHGAGGARRLLVSAQVDGGLALFECAPDAPGLAASAFRLHDGRGVAELRFDGVCLPADALVAGPPDAAAIVDDALAFATVALCAQSLGAMRKALALTVEYLRTRRQFGRHLAEYQALQHRVVEHYRQWIDAGVLVREAAHDWDGLAPRERLRRASAAKWQAGVAGRAIALDSLQMHGAVGLQDETAISHYARRLVADDLLLGDSTAHLARYAEPGAESG